MAYSTYTKDRVVPSYKIEIKPSYTSYMKVEDVLRYLNKKALPLQQYKLGEMGCHFFQMNDVQKRINNPVLFRSMECDVVQYLIENK